MSTVSIFTLPAALFSSPLAAVLDAKQAGARAALMVHIAQENEQKRAEAESAEPEKKDGSGCRMCDVVLTTAEERTAHFKSAWHLFNLKLKISGQKSVSEKEMTELQSAGDLSSGDEHEGSAGESSSEEDEEERKAAKEDEDDVKGREKSPKLTFVATSGTTVTVWRNLFPREAQYLHEGEYLSHFGPAFAALAHQRMWAVLMSGGGHFAGALFNGDKIVRHKTFRRYTVRKKQGGSQSTRDKQGHAPQSAGAQIRRANEAKLREEVMHLLSVEWAADLKSMHLVFLAAPGANKFMFIRDGLLTKEDPRLRSVPFTTGRATLVEVKRVHSLLSQADKGEHTAEEIAEAKRVAEQAHKTTPAPVAVPAAAEVRSAVAEPDNLLLNAVIVNDVATVRRLLSEGYEAPVPKDAMKINTPLYVATKNGNVELVKLLLEQPRTNPSIPVPADLFRTPLHAAMLNGNEELMTMLLQRGADPTLRDRAGKTPADLIAQKSVRSALCAYAAAHPKQCEWQRANVQPMTEAEQKEREEEKAEKQRQKKKAQAQRQKQRKAEDKERAAQEEVERQKKEIEDKEKAEMDAVFAAKHAKEAAMTDRERRALAAEARAGVTKGGVRLCDFCAAPLLGVPFERLNWKYCTTKCVVAHKQKIGQ